MHGFIINNNLRILLKFYRKIENHAQYLERKLRRENFLESFFFSPFKRKDGEKEQLTSKGTLLYLKFFSIIGYCGTYMIPFVSVGSVMLKVLNTFLSFSSRYIIID